MSKNTVLWRGGIARENRTVPSAAKRVIYRAAEMYQVSHYNINVSNNGNEMSYTYRPCTRNTYGIGVLAISTTIK